MQNRFGMAASFVAGTLACGLFLAAQTGRQDTKKDGAGDRPRDPAAEATSPREAPADRPEAKRTDHDDSEVFRKPAHVSPALKKQPKGAASSASTPAATRSTRPSRSPPWRR